VGEVESIVELWIEKRGLGSPGETQENKSIPVLLSDYVGVKWNYLFFGMILLGGRFLTVAQVFVMRQGSTYFRVF